MATFHRTTSSFQHGARTLPGECYTSGDILAEELERIHARSWNCIGRASAIAAPGDYMLAELAGESIIVLRDRQNTVRAFFNICRHRGTRICRERSGRLGETIQCPYHAWTYGLDGKLIAAPHMQEAEDFDKADHPLHPAAITEWNGFLFVNIAERPEPFENAWAAMFDRFDRFELANLVVGHHAHYDVRANWKLVFQNYNECLHCPTIHPELAAVLPYQSGANDLVEGPFLGGYMDIKAPNLSCTLSGKPAGDILSDELSEEDRHRGYYYSAFPNMLLSVHPDYLNYYIVRPREPNRTIVDSEWLFHPKTPGGESNNIQDAVDFWDVTNRQDWDIIERSQLGISSRRYAPGPYSPRESIPAAWDREYLRLMRRD